MATHPLVIPGHPGYNEVLFAVHHEKVRTILDDRYFWGFYKTFEKAKQVVDTVQSRVKTGRIVISIFSPWGLVHNYILNMDRIVPFTGSTLWGWRENEGREVVHPFRPSVSWQSEDFFHIVELTHMIEPNEIPCNILA